MINKSIFSIVLIAAAMTGAMVLSSCSHDEATYSEENFKEAKHAEALAKYQQSFISMFGQPASNQCWDFTLANSAKTRASGGKALANWPQESYNVYGYKWKYETGNTDFNESIINKIYHNGWTDLVAEINAATPQDWAPKGTYKFRLAGAEIPDEPSGSYYTLGADFVTNGHNTYILRQIKTNGNTSGVTGDQHTDAINFDVVNAANPTWFTVATSVNNNKATVNSAERKIQQFVEVQKEYNGKTYTFWGFKVDDSYANIVLIVDQIEAPTYLYAKRYFVEDLGSVGHSDIDFNDVVFDVVEYTNHKQECIVRALGGTIPVTITVCGVSWSKPSPVIESMINTGVGSEVIDPYLEYATFTIENWDPEDNSSISVQVQDKNGFTFVNSFPLNGDIPLMVAFSIGKSWMHETQPISDAWMSATGE